MGAGPEWPLRTEKQRPPDEATHRPLGHAAPRAFSVHEHAQAKGTPMARPEKVAKVDEIKERITSAGAAVLTEYRGLTVT